MKIHQLFTDNTLRNFTYIIELGNKNAYVIDPWCDQQVNNFLDKKHLSLVAVINTHEHWDHTQGNEALVAKHGCEVWAHVVGRGKIPQQTRYLNHDEVIVLDDNTTLKVIDTPGHCQAHLCFLIEHNGCPHSLFTGDILFNAGVGNCYNGGNVEDLYETVTEKISTLSDRINILPGHEYFENNLKFTLDREPSNEQAKIWLEKFYQSDVFNSPLKTTIADEKEINTFLRLDKNEIRNNLTINHNDDKSTFIELRKLRDKW